MHADVVGNVFSSIGASGFDLLNSILMADLTPLKYRGLAMGLLTSPYLVRSPFPFAFTTRFRN